MEKPTNGKITGKISDASLHDALKERYLSYALSTILSRSLPDVRDGLKPVHRRLLYAMKLMKLVPTSMPKKSARVVGDVIGRFHPHGDTAIYEALVRLAQDFAARYPLIEGHGNFGSIDGDNAAAMRYTEARLTPFAEALMEGLSEDSVDFRSTYDGDGEEPIVLPAAFPNLLANGSTGIAVGMATNIPPHNATELCEALMRLVENPDITLEDLLCIIKGPDFPTGGLLIESSESMTETYATGRGSFRLRACWHTETLKNGQYQIVVTEIPYQVPKSRLIEKTADLLLNKKLPLLIDIRDESAEEIRIVLEPRTRAVDPDVLMESLFRATDLETRVSLNLNVVDKNGVPGVLSLKQTLNHFLQHRHEVLLRRTHYQLSHVQRRLEILDGYQIAYLNLDEVIRIIREEDDPDAALKKRFHLTDMQTEAILNMRLRSLRKLEEMVILTEKTQLGGERQNLTELLESHPKQWQEIKAQVARLKDMLDKDKVYGPRRTALGTLPVVQEIPMDAMVEREAITVFYSRMGWVRAIKGHQINPADNKYKEGDEGRYTLFCYTTDKLILLTSHGRSHGILADKVTRGRGHGDPIRLLVDLAQDDDVLYIGIHRSFSDHLLLVGSDGKGFKIREEDLLAQTKAGKQVFNCGENTRLMKVLPLSGDYVAIVGTHRKLLVFPVDEIPEMTRGRGVTLQKYREARLSDIITFSLQAGLSWAMVNGNKRTVTDLLAWLGHRGQAGRLPPTGFPRDNMFT